MGRVKPSERIKLIDEDGVLIVAPLSHNAGCKYGANTKWCTAVVETSLKFEDSLCKGAVLYVIIKGNFLKDEEKYALFYSDKEWEKVYNKHNQELPETPPHLKGVLNKYETQIDEYVKKWLRFVNTERQIAIEAKSEEINMMKMLESFYKPPKKEPKKSKKPDERPVVIPEFL